MKDATYSKKRRRYHIGQQGALQAGDIITNRKFGRMQAGDVIRSTIIASVSQYSPM